MGKIRKLLQLAIDAATEPNVLEEIGETMTERIRRRTRLGKGVQKPEARPSNLKKLEPETVAVRKRLKKRGRLTGPRATPAKSGLNRTGQMLESLDYKVKNKEVEFKLDKQGERKAEDLIKTSKDFTFMNLSKPEVNAVVDIIEKNINKKIK